MPRFTLAPQLLNNSAEVLSGGKIYFYDTGTTTLKTTYSDSAETTANSNPVVLDSSGRVPDIFFTGSAKVVIKTSDDVQLDVIDPVVNSFNNLGGSELILDADGDTSITADTDDQVDFKIGGLDDFQMTANTFTALSGSTIKTDTLAETTSANGVLVDGNRFKDSVQYQVEVAAAIADVAGQGQWWVKSDTPNIPMFTNDAGTDFQLASLDGTETLTAKTLTTPTVNNPTLVLKQSATPTPTANGDIQWDSDNFKLVIGDGTDQQVIVTTEGISGDVTINTSGVSAIGSGVIVNADINASAAIDATKIHDGSVDNTEFGYLNGVTSAIQTQLGTKAPIADPTFTGEIGIGVVNVSETELGILEGATVTTAELNILDGVTATTAELNYVSSVTGPIQTQLGDKQPLDPGLTSIAGLTTAADKMVYTTASDTYAVTDLTSFARTLLDDSDQASAAHTILDNASLTAATIAADDKILLQDTDGSGVLKTATAQSVADLGPLKYITQTLLTGTSSAIEFTTATSGLLDGTYEEYVFVINNMSAGTDGASLIVDFSNDAGVGWNDFTIDSCNVEIEGTAGTSSGSENSDSTWEVVTNQTNFGTQGISAVMRLIDSPSNSGNSLVKAFIHGDSWDATGEDHKLFWAVGTTRDNYIMPTGVRFLFSTGVISRAQITVYGVRRS